MKLGRTQTDTAPPSDLSAVIGWGLLFAPKQSRKSSLNIHGIWKCTVGIVAEKTTDLYTLQGRPRAFVLGVVLVPGRAVSRLHLPNTGLQPSQVGYQWRRPADIYSIANTGSHTSQNTGWGTHVLVFNTLFGGTGFIIVKRRFIWNEILNKYNNQLKNGIKY